MNEDQRTEPLQEWNRLARENTENAIVSSMFQAASEVSGHVEQYVTWLLVGTAAVASFFIGNGDKIIPMVTSEGFLVCGAFLCFSCIFGLFAKIYGLRCTIGSQVGNAVRETFRNHLNAYQREEARIQEGAKFWGITIDTGIRIERVISEFYKTLPKWVVWFANRHLNKHRNDPQIGYIPMIKNFNMLGFWAFFQSLAFLGFLISGFVYAAL